MAWTTARTWVTAEIETASIFNTHVRDNLNFLKSGIQSVTLTTTTPGATSGTTEQILATSSAITYDGSTPVKIECSWYNINKTVAGDAFIVYLYDGTTPGSGTQIATWIANGAGSGSTVVGSGSLRTAITPTAGAHTYTARLVRSSGTGTATLSCGATTPLMLTIEQVN